MRDFPSCFGESGIQVSDSSSSSSSSTSAKTAPNLVTCVYQSILRGRTCAITVTWTKSLMGQGLTVAVDDDQTLHSLCKFEIKPWLFHRRKGSKTLDSDSAKIAVFWDLTSAKFGHNPEPLLGFYLAVTFDGEIALLLGDKKIESESDFESLRSNSNTVFVAKREHVFGKKSYSARAQFCDKGETHDVAIECDVVGMKEPSLVIRIDSKAVMAVKRLKWKFRGNGTIVVDGIPVEVFWDVHDWLFGGGATGSAVFMFQSSVAAEKAWPDPARLGFSLVLYAWRNE